MNQHILIVDDEPFMLRHIEAALKQGGFTVASCRSGELALEWAAERPPLLVIMDFIMPGLDGLETLRYMRVLPSLNSIPVIMLTDKGYAPTTLDAEECGVQAVLTKPFSPEQLLEEVKRLLPARSAAA
jgi:DNA-binding response OmpR family regulator